jgi:hypothetical protein
MSVNAHLAYQRVRHTENPAHEEPGGIWQKCITSLPLKGFP